MAQTQLAILLTSVALVVIGLYSAIFVDNIIKDLDAQMRHPDLIGIRETERECKLRLIKRF